MKLCPTCMAELAEAPPPHLCPPVSPLNKLKLLWCDPCQLTWNEEYLRGFWFGFRTCATLARARTGLDGRMLRLTPPEHERLKKRIEGYERMVNLFNGPGAPPME